MKNLLFVLCACFVFSCSSSEVEKQQGIQNTSSSVQPKLPVQKNTEKEQNITATTRNITKQSANNTINPSKTSVEVKYFLDEVDKTVSLTVEQRTTLSELSTPNITSKLALQKQLNAGISDPTEKKKIRAKIVARTKEEQRNLEKILTPEQYTLYKNKQQERKVNNQVKNLTSLLFLSEQQQKSLRDLITENNFSNVGLSSELQKAKKDKKQYATLIKKRKTLRSEFDETISKILSDNQYEKYRNSRYGKLFGAKSK